MPQGLETCTEMRPAGPQSLMPHGYKANKTKPLGHTEPCHNWPQNHRTRPH